MHKTIRWACATAAALVLAHAPLAQAQQVSTLIHFEDPNIVGLYSAGDSFEQGSYHLAVGADAASVDSVGGLQPFAQPSGNAGQFYTQANDGELIISHAQGALFSLQGFSAAYVPVAADSAPNTVLIAFATYANGDNDFNTWDFAPKAGGSYAFASYDTPADFSFFTNMRQLEFFSCSLVNGELCSELVNNGQFALDDILLTAAVPEPATQALLALGLLGLAWRGRQQHGARARPAATAL